MEMDWGGSEPRDDDFSRVRTNLTMGVRGWAGSVRVGGVGVEDRKKIGKKPNTGKALMLM